MIDGSNLYPEVLAELWPEADHQPYAFHIINDINKLILDALARLRTGMSRRGKAGRKEHGRRGKQAKVAACRGICVKEKAHFLFKHRYSIVKRRENLSASERDDLQRMLDYLPELAMLRRFAQPEEVFRSKKRSRTTGHANGKQRPKSLKGLMASVSDRERPGILPLTINEVSDHFRRTIQGGH